jgi:hypothetical protein
MDFTKTLSNKNILLFSPQFFGYGLEVASKMRDMGASVDYYDERPGNDFWTKAIIRVNKSLLRRKIETYYTDIINKLADDRYDFVVFLNPEAISRNNLELLRKGQPKATFIMYMWDSLRNKKYTIDILPFFDRKFSFDKADCTNVGYGLHFRPLFFLDGYRDVENIPQKMAIDLFFVGTVHSDRYALLMALRKAGEKLGKKIEFYMFFQSKILFYRMKAFNKSFRRAQQKDFKFIPMAKDKLLEKLSSSKIILDIQHPSQQGLTMRTIEMIGARKKMITTNSEIIQYDFYHPNNILVIDRQDIEIDPDFFDSPYVELERELYQKYSIEGWLEDLFWAPLKV